MMLVCDIVLVQTTLDDVNNRLDDEWWITIEGMGLRIMLRWMSEVTR